MFAAPSYGGGPGTKYRQLLKGAAKSGEPYGTVICLSAIRVPLAVLWFLKWRGARVVVNQNGVYYPMWCPDGYERKNRFLASLNHCASHSFFQSEFSEESYSRWVGTLPENRSVLYNAVDRAVFYPDLDRATNSGEPRILVFLDFRPLNEGLWRHLLPLLRNRDLPYKWVLMGAVGDESLVAFLRSELVEADLEWVFRPDLSTTASKIRDCDAALHLVYNDVCPNKVLECLASGVHVICLSAGGTKELLRNGGGEVLEVPSGYEERIYPTVPELLAALERFRSRSMILRTEAARASTRFDLDAWIRAMAGNA